MHGEDIDANACFAVLCFCDIVLVFTDFLEIHNAVLCVQGKNLSEAELQGIIAMHDLDCNGVFDEVLCMFILALVSIGSHAQR